MGEVNITSTSEIGLQKWKYLSFIGKEKLLKSVDMKSNHEIMMKKMMEFSFIMEVRMMVRVSLGDSLNKNISRKK